MPEYAIRFGVSNDKGARSEIWKCWTRTGQGKRDVYLSFRALGGTMKLSLHECGAWHMGYDPATFQTLFREGDQPESRFAEKWKRPAAVEGGIVLAVRIQVPFEAVNIPSPEQESKIIWIKSPSEGEMVEIAIFLSDQLSPDASIDWRPLKATFIGRLSLEKGGGAWIAFRHVPCTYPAHGPVVRRRFARDASPEHLTEEVETLRYLIWGNCEDGSIGLFESPALLENIEAVRP